MHIKAIWFAFPLAITSMAQLAKAQGHGHEGSPHTHPPRVYQAPVYEKNWSKPSLHPDHIVLNFAEDPATSISVSWRTSPEVKEAYAEIALATAAPKFWRNARTVPAETQTMDASLVLTAEVIANYHTVTFRDLMPDTLYAYRVGDGEHWSEWIQFKTAAREDQPFSFLYVGDAQNYILELWSRLIREGYRKQPDASFIIHAGDLVTDAHDETQWHEWFTAGGWIHRMLPSVPVPGNHEYEPYNEREEAEDIEHLSVQWKPQFNLPGNGPEGMEETVYYVDYQNIRIIALNSSKNQELQASWMRQVLENNPKTWIVATFHHPLFSASQGRDNTRLRELWKPIFDEFGVDLVLQGHDHSYARGRVNPLGVNVVDGLNMRDETGTVYVVSVSGGKMYDLKPNGWEDFEASRDRAAENTQLFQVIQVHGDSLKFEAYTATGDLYDAFTLIKGRNGSSNRFIEQKSNAIPARRHHNTIAYQDVLPEAIQDKLQKHYSDFEFDDIRYVRNEQFEGYLIEMENETHEVNLVISMTGEILEERLEED